MSSVWYKLDNSAKIFPAVANSINSSVYRMSVVLKEEIDEIKLQRASDKLFEIYPMYMVGLKMGLFWYYLNPLKKPVQVQEEIEYPCAPINFREDNSMIKILYSGHRISVEVFHSLTDGSGALEFLKSLLYFYMSEDFDIKDEGLIRIVLNDDLEDFEDSYVNYSSKYKASKKRLPRALNIEGTAFNYPGNNIITGQIDTNELLSVARSYNVTITVLLSAVLTQAIMRVTENKKQRPIVISIPVNLRNHFKSKTLRNFFAVANVSVDLPKSASFDEILSSTQEDYLKEMHIDSLQELINKNVAFQNYPLIKYVPTKLKNKAINLGVLTIGEKTKTMTLTNLGRMILPTVMNDHIETFEASLYPTKKSPINAAMISSHDRVSLSFISRIQETEIIKEFFTILSHDLNCTVSIYSNDWDRGGNYEVL